jgi:peptide/nickel transport system permease protein
MLAGVLLIGFFASDQYWHWFPTAGLSDRAALDMTFLPHWSSAGDIALLFALACAGALIFVAASRYLPTKLRAVFGGVVGAGLGVLMASALTEPSIATGVVLALLLGGLGYAIGRAEFAGLRTALLGLTGVLLGIGLAAHWAGGEFSRGFLLDRLWHLALPILCLSYGGFAFLAKLTRTAVLENLLADYARTARAKGVAENDVLWRHVFRNSLLPLITVSAGLLPGLLGGSIIIEALFSIDGMGKLAVEAVQGRDRELVLSITLIGGVLTLIGYLIADLCSAIADPRISYD